MRFRMLSAIFKFIADTRQAVIDFCSLLTNPTSIMAAFGLVLQLLAASMLAGVFPFLVRALILPDSIERSTPLNVLFDTCKDQLHGVCSFPTASVDLRATPMFSPKVYYALIVKLHFVEVENTKKLGLFQNVIRTYNDEGKMVRQFSKTSYLREPSFLTKASWVLFLPFYLTGFFADPSRLEVPITNEYYETTDNPAHRLDFQLQNRFAQDGSAEWSIQVESAELIVTARFGFVRHFLYYYPMMSFSLLWLSSFIFLCSMITLHWGFRGSATPPKMIKQQIVRRSPKQVNREASSEKALSMSSSRSLTSSYEEVPRPDERRFLKQDKVHDEFIPGNVDEMPECVTELRLEGLNDKTIKEEITVGDTNVRRRR